MTNQTKVYLTATPGPHARWIPRTTQVVICVPNEFLSQVGNEISSVSRLSHVGLNKFTCARRIAPRYVNDDERRGGKTWEKKIKVERKSYRPRLFRSTTRRVASRCRVKFVRRDKGNARDIFRYCDKARRSRIACPQRGTQEARMRFQACTWEILVNVARWFSCVFTFVRMLRAQWPHPLLLCRQIYKQFIPSSSILPCAPNAARFGKRGETIHIRILY